jgi:hypothetical protein
MKTGTTVRVIQPVIEGVVKNRRINPADEIELLVEWAEGGETVERWFDADQLQPVEPQPEETAS